MDSCGHFFRQAFRTTLRLFYLTSEVMCVSDSVLVWLPLWFVSLILNSGGDTLGREIKKEVEGGRRKEC